MIRCVQNSVLEHAKGSVAAAGSTTYLSWDNRAYTSYSKEKGRRGVVRCSYHLVDLVMKSQIWWSVQCGDWF